MNPCFSPALRRVPLLCALALGLAPRAALAEPSATEKATADALFSEGKKLANEGRFVEACPRFAQSQKLDPGVGTLLYLGECYEKTARVASAWAAFRDAADMARATNQAPREKIATARAAALEPRLPRILIELEAAAAAQNPEVRHDNEPIVKALLGAAFPLDAGTHVIAASAPGKKPWSTTVELSEGATTRVKIPALEPLPAAPPAASSAAPPPTAPPTASAPPPPPPSVSVDTSSLGPRKTVALVVGGLGVVSAGLGGYFGLRAFSLWDDSRANCVGNRCGSEGSRNASLASNNATASTLSFALGAVGIGAGVALWFWPSSADRSTSLRVGPGAISVEGKW